MDVMTFTYSSKLKFIAMMFYIVFITSVILIIFPISEFKEYSVFAIGMGSFILLILYYQTSRSFCARISIDETKVAYRGIFKKRIIALEDIVGAYMFWNESGSSARGPGMLSMRLISSLRDIDAAHSNSINGSIIILPLEKHRPTKSFRYTFFPATNEYIAFEYRTELKDVISFFLEVRETKRKERMIELK